MLTFQFGIENKIVDVTQVERYGPYTTVYGYFTDRITAVISGTEVWPYHNEITAVYCENTVRLRRHMKQFTVKIRIAVTIDLGREPIQCKYIIEYETPLVCDEIDDEL
jgi:hypothetical protein